MPVHALQRLTSITRSNRANYQLGSYLAFIAGAVNAGGFLAINRYTSHMSGIISAVGDDLALGNVTAVMAGLALLFFFCIRRHHHNDFGQLGTTAANP